MRVNSHPEFSVRQLRRLRRNAQAILRRRAVPPGRIDPDDLTQEVMVRMLRAHRRGTLPQTTDRVMAWAVGTLRHVVADELRSWARMRPQPVEPTDELRRTTQPGSQAPLDGALLRRLTARQREAVEILLSGERLASAARRLRIDRATLLGRTRRAIARISSRREPRSLQATPPAMPYLDRRWFQQRPARWYPAYSLRRGAWSTAAIASALGCSPAACKQLLRRIRRAAARQEGRNGRGGDH